MDSETKHTTPATTRDGANTSLWQDTAELDQPLKEGHQIQDQIFELLTW